MVTSIAISGSFGGVVTDALFPVIFYAAVGAVADRFLDLDRRSLSRLLVYVFVPALLFSNFMNVRVAAGDVGRVAVFCAVILFGMAGAGWGFARCLRLDAATASGVTMAVTFFNMVNLGFPVALFAFGDEGFRLASVLAGVVAIPHNVFGLLIAARGSLTRREAFRTLIRMPFLYVLAAALLCRWAGWRPPAFVMGPVTTLGEAGVPLVLVAVGMELGRMRVGALSGALLGTVLIRLVGAPLLAWWVSGWVGLDGLLRSVVVLQASMPSAIMPIVYARLFDGNVDFVSRAVFFTTVGSLLTLPVLLMWLG